MFWKLNSFYRYISNTGPVLAVRHPSITASTGPFQYPLCAAIMESIQKYRQSIGFQCCSDTGSGKIPILDQYFNVCWVKA